jgi:hypothetical protein
LDYSEERPTAAPFRNGKYKWRIDNDRPARNSTDDWELRMLAAYPGRAPRESVKQLVVRLKRETLLGRAFVQSLHAYVCKPGH